MDAWMARAETHRDAIVMHGGPLGKTKRVGPGGVQPGGPDDELADMVSAVLADTEDTWGALFARGGRQYQPPRLVLFSGAVDSSCGFASAAVGPFYCPPDRS